MFKVKHAWANGLVNITMSLTSVERTWNKYGSAKKGITPKLLSEMALKKPHYKKKGQFKIINPVSRKLFQPKGKEKTGNKPNIKDIASYLYASVSNACAFQYLNVEASAIYPPEDDIKVKDTLFVETSTRLPKSTPEMVSSVENVDALVTVLNSITKEQIDLIELRTRGQSDNKDWSAQCIGRITASISRRVLTKVRALLTCVSV
jgi:hypothetical protein